MKKNYKSLKKPITEIGQIFFVYVGFRMIFRGDNNIQQISQQLKIIKLFRTNQISTTETAKRLSKVGLPDQAVNSFVLRSEKAHGPSRIPYSSGDIRWTTDQSKTPLWPSSKKINFGGWEIISDSPTLVDLHPSTFPRSVEPSEQERYTEDDVRDLTKDDAGNWTYDTSYSTGKIDQKDENDLTTEFANSNSEQAPETPKLEKDLAESGVDSYSNTRVLNAEVRNSPTIDVRDSSPPSMVFDKTEHYQLVEPTYTWTQPVAFGGSIFGQSVLFLSGVALIVFNIRNFVFKPKESVVERRQAAILAKEREKATFFFKKWGRMLPFVQTYYLRRDITTAFTVVAYQNQSLTRDQASYILRESCGLAEEEIQVWLPTPQGGHQDAANP